MVSFGELRDDYFQRLLLAGRSEHTVRKYVASIEDFEQFATHHQVAESTPAYKIDRKLIGAYQLDLSKRRGPDGTVLSLSTRNVYGSALRGLLRHGVTVMGPINLASGVPHHSSQVYARNLTAFLANLVKDGKVRPAESDDIIRDTLLTQGGEVVNARVREALGLPALVAQ